MLPIRKFHTFAGQLFIPFSFVNFIHSLGNLPS